MKKYRILMSEWKERREIYSLYYVKFETKNKALDCLGKLVRDPLLWKGFSFQIIRIESVLFFSDHEGA